MSIRNDSGKGDISSHDSGKHRVNIIWPRYWQNRFASVMDSLVEAMQTCAIQCRLIENRHLLRYL